MTIQKQTSRKAATKCPLCEKKQETIKFLEDAIAKLESDIEDLQKEIFVELEQKSTRRKASR